MGKNRDFLMKIGPKNVLLSRSAKKKSWVGEGGGVIMPQVAFAPRLCKRFNIDCFVKTTNCLENLPRQLQYI